MIDKILVEVNRRRVDIDLDGMSLDEAIAYLDTLRTDVVGEEQKFVMEWDIVELVSYRYETDKEYEKRLARLEKVKERKKAERLKKAEKEKKEYERLKAKYGE